MCQREVLGRNSIIFLAGVGRFKYQCRLLCILLLPFKNAGQEEDGTERVDILLFLKKIFSQ